MSTAVRKPLSWFMLVPQPGKNCSQLELAQLGESLKICQLQPVVVV
jgi:hypothetical protein